MYIFTDYNYYFSQLFPDDISQIQVDLAKLQVKEGVEVEAMTKQMEHLQV
jgi:hypothetical protein